ncbi:MAG: hypothetical protein ACI81R_000211 [Bradymonadia bacterium]|jgi:hypothetical protein
MARSFWLALAAAAPLAFVACGADDGGDPCNDSNGDRIVDLGNDQIGFATTVSTTGTATYSTTQVIAPDDSEQRFIYEVPCTGGSLTAQLSPIPRDDGGTPRPLPEDWRAAISFNSDSPLASAVTSTEPGAVGFATTPASINIEQEDGPYVVIVPPPPAGECGRYQLLLQATCPIATDEVCDNEQDDDLDGLADCDDPDCNLPFTDVCLPPLRCSAADDDDLEDNNSLGSATLIDLVSSAAENGYAEYNADQLFLRNQDDDRDGDFEADEDWFRVDLCENGRMFVYLRASDVAPEAPYVISVSAPDGSLDSRSFYPDRETGQGVRIPFRLGDREPQPVFVQVSHTDEDSCSEYSMQVGLTCGECFGLDLDDGEDVFEPNQNCLNPFEVGDGDTLPFDATIRNEWPPDETNLEAFRRDQDWYSVNVCAGGSVTVTTTVPEGPQPEYTLDVVRPDGLACDFVEPVTSITDTGSQSITVENPSDEEEAPVFFRVGSDVLGACMRYQLDYTIACPTE